MERPFLIVDGGEQHKAVRALVDDLHELVEATEGGDEVDSHSVSVEAPVVWRSAPEDISGITFCAESK